MSFVNRWGIETYRNIAGKRRKAMWTKKQVLVTSRPDGTIEVLPMRYNASHQRGWRCFLGALAGESTKIDEDTVPSFQGRSLFDALAVYRKSIEPGGGRLLQAVASGDCWADDRTYDRFCRRLTPRSPTTELIDGFLPIALSDSVSLDEQRARYEAWCASLPAQAETGNAPQSRAKQALDQSNAAIRAAGEAAILSRGDLPPPKNNV